MKEEHPLFLVETLTVIRNQYVVRAKSLEHAYDEVSMIDSGAEEDYFEPVSQKFMPEHIVDGRKISRKKFDKLLAKLEKTKEGSPWMGDALIRDIDYGV